MFYFSNGFLYKGTEMSWENVSGSKITYFSEQSRGLIKYVIDQNELENVN